jgi:hypothetical protein
MPESQLTPADARAHPIQRYARVAGVLMLLSMVFGYLGEMYVPTKFIPSASEVAGATQRIADAMALYRFGFAAYLVEAFCDVALSALFYVMLKPVHRPLALAAAFFGLVSTSLYGVGEIFYFIPTIWARGAAFMNAFTPEQINALTVLSLRIFGRVGWIFLGMYGIATMLRGYLVYRSGFLPKALGVLLMLGGAGFLARNVTYVLAPAYSSAVFLAPMAIAGISLTVWLLAKGVDAAAWDARAATATQI